MLPLEDCNFTKPQLSTQVLNSSIVIHSFRLPSIISSSLRMQLKSLHLCPVSYAIIKTTFGINKRDQNFRAIRNLLIHNHLTRQMHHIKLNIFIPHYLNLPHSAMLVQESLKSMLVTNMSILSSY